MSKYVPDVTSHRWVIVSQSRFARPENSGGTKKKACPFCPGNELMTSGEVKRYGEGEKDGPGWELRVIPNRFPITDFHEVIIHSPGHDKDIVEMTIPQVQLIFRAYRSRYNYYRKQGQVLIFRNHGEHAGASQEHPHSQLVVIPSQINLDSLAREPLNNLVLSDEFFNVYCPDFSQWPYEVWIAPKKEGTVYGDITDDEMYDLAGIMQKMLKKLCKIHDREKLSSLPFGYNYYIHPRENWFIRIIPRFVQRAGFELGTGLSVNVIDPLTASLELRDGGDKMANVLQKLREFKG